MGSTANRLPTVRVPAEPSVNENGVGERAVGFDRVVDAELVVDAERREAVAQLVDRAQPLHLDDGVAGHSSASRRCAMSASTARSLVGPPRRAGRGRVGADPTPQLEEHRRVVAVGRDRRPERERAEVLEQVVELVERAIAVGPEPVALGERLGRERRQARAGSRSRTDHVDGEVVAGEHVEVGPDPVAEREPVPLGGRVTATSAWRRCSSRMPSRPS